MSFFIDFVRRQYTAIPYPIQSFSGQTVIVTGSNTGLGFEAAKHIVRLNAAKVIIAVRSISKGEAAAKAIADETGRSGVCEVWELDMASYPSIRAFVKRTESLDRLDVALLNASISKSTYEELNGTESSVSVNVYGTFLLALDLLPVLRKSGKKVGKPPRLTIVSSDIHMMTAFKERTSPDIFKALADPNSKFLGDRYGVTKLLQIFIIRSLAREMKIGSHASEPVILNHVSPGLCYSSLMRDGGWLFHLIARIPMALLARTTEVGSRNYIAAITAGEESHGKWFSEYVVTPESDYVRSDEGLVMQEKIWDEIKVILEGIQPGVLKNI